MKDTTERVAAVVNSSGVKTEIANVFNIRQSARRGNAGEKTTNDDLIRQKTCRARISE